MNTVRTFGFDARLAGSQHAGIGRYSEELLRFLLEPGRAAAANVHWIIWVNSLKQLPWLSSDSGCEVRITSATHYTLSEQTVWLKELLSANLDLLYVPHFNIPLGYRRPFVMTLHDLLWHTQNDARATTLPSWQYAVKRRLYMAVSESAIARAERVIVPSQTVQQEVLQIVGREEGVEVIPEGVPEIYRSVGKVKRSHSGKERAPYAVYTGSLYPHKNLEVVLRALALDSRLHLKVASARSIFVEEFQARAQAEGVADQVEWLGYIPDVQLIALYQEATALIQPSRSEGFGLTGLEALAAGCSVLASDIPIFHEVYGEYAQFFDPSSPESLQKVWSALLEQPQTQEHRDRAQTYAQSYTWEALGERVWQILLETSKRLE